MRLYANKVGEWVGTQAEAKKIGATMVEVPTDKPNLLKWLNDFTSAIDVAAKEVIEEKKTIQKPPKAHAWETIRECAKKATIEDLTVAMCIYMDRVQDIADKQKESTSGN
jgi:hypothetical protein